MYTPFEPVYPSLVVVDPPSANTPPLVPVAADVNYMNPLMKKLYTLTEVINDGNICNTPPLCLWLLMLIT